MAVALSVQMVSFAYSGRPVLHDVCFDIGEGETVLLLGPNGAGKTTLFSLISGLFHPASGHVEIAGERLRPGRNEALKRLGIVFQAQTLDLDLTVMQNLLYAAALHGLPRSTARPRIEENLVRMGLRERAGERVRNLNGGHRRRVEIVRASLHDPDILILDEPTVGLDIPTRKEFVRDLHAQSRSILWATHLIDEVLPGDRVIVLHQGRVVGDGTPDELIRETAVSDLAGAYAKLTSMETAA